MQSKTPTNKPVHIHNGDFSNATQHWTLESHNKNDAQYDLEDGTLRMQRTLPGYFMRAYQDVKVKPGTTYQVMYRMKIGASGNGRGWVILKSKANGWLEKKIVYGPMQYDRDWKTVTLTVTAQHDVNMLRLNFGPRGQNAAVWVDDVKIKQVGVGRATVKVPQSQKNVVLDGKLDDPLWRDAVVLNDFRVLGEPNRSAASKTNVRLVVRGNDLYIGYRATEPNMDQLVTQIQRDDIAAYADDAVETFLSPDGKRFNQFIVNALGYGDVVELGRGKGAFRQVWYSANDVNTTTNWAKAAHQEDGAWTVEMRIDLPRLFSDNATSNKTSGGTSGGKTSGGVLYANFCRHRPRNKSYYSNWAGMVGPTFHDPTQFQALELDWTIPKVTKRKAQSLTFTHQLTPPKSLIAGKPVGLTRQAGAAWALPGSLIFDEQNITLDPQAKRLVADSVSRSDATQTATVVCRLWTGKPSSPDLSHDEARRLNSPEAFKLTIRPNGVVVAGRTQAGVLRGLATLALEARWAKRCGQTTLPCIIIEDGPMLERRGWLLAARSPQDLKRQIQILYLLRYNTVMFEVGAYGADALFPFASHPHIGKHNTTPAQWRDAADYAKALGINPVPKFYSWSRAGYILNKPQYRHLAENKKLGHGSRVNAAHNKNFCSSLPESYSLLFDLFEELIDTLDITDLHIGHDELHYDDLVTCAVCRQAGVKRSDWIIQTVTRTRDFLKSKGVKLWIYADCLDPAQNARHFDISGPEILRRLPKDVVLQDWKYRGDRKTGLPSLKMFADAGFDVVGSSWQWQDNIDAMNAELARVGGLGFVGTSWNATNPQTISPELVSAISLGAYLSWSPQGSDLSSFPFVPSLLFQTAAYASQTSAQANVRIVPTPKEAVSGRVLCDGLGLVPASTAEFLLPPVRDDRGVRFQPFTLAGKPAGMIVRGSSNKTTSIVLQGKARYINLLHTFNRQAIHSDMHAMNKHYQGVDSGQYMLHYADGTQTQLILQIRRTITTWDDHLAPSQNAPVLFGTVNGRYHINISGLTWKNPYPDKVLHALEMVGSNRKGLDLVLLGVSLGT